MLYNPIGDVTPDVPSKRSVKNFQSDKLANHRPKKIDKSVSQSVARIQRMRPHMRKKPEKHFPGPQIFMTHSSPRYFSITLSIQNTLLSDLLKKHSSLINSSEDPQRIRIQDAFQYYRTSEHGDEKCCLSSCPCPGHRKPLLSNFPSSQCYSAPFCPATRGRWKL